VVHARARARNTLRIVRQNLRLGGALQRRLHAAGAGGLAAALGRRPGHGLSSLLVVLNALRARHADGA
jgi:cation transport ATPase